MARQWQCAIFILSTSYLQVICYFARFLLLVKDIYKITVSQKKLLNSPSYLLGHTLKDMLV